MRNENVVNSTALADDEAVAAEKPALVSRWSNADEAPEPRVSGAEAENERDDNDADDDDKGMGTDTAAVENIDSVSCVGWACSSRYVCCCGCGW